jgi:hypothetical protein
MERSAAFPAQLLGRFETMMATEASGHDEAGTGRRS